MTPTWRDARAWLLGVGIVTPLAAAEGGYYPTSWGWAAAALAWIAALALLLRDTVRLSRLELAGVGAFGGLAVWTATSALWSSSVGETVLEVERLLVYVAGLAAALLVVRSGSYRALLGGVCAAVALVSSYAVATKLVPEGFLVAQSVAGNRLSQPVGYWNGLGLLAALGALLALGLVAHGRRPATRASAAAALVPMLLALYFTFSRGAWLALGVGLVTAVALDSRRLRLVAGLLAAGLWPALAVVVASRSEALTSIDATSAAATDAGRRLLALALVLAAGGAATALALGAAERRIAVGTRARRSFGAALVAGLASLLLLVFVRFGDPVSIVRDGYRAFNTPPVPVESDLNDRLFSFSGSWRGDLWRAGLAEYADHPLLGSGGGTYERAWLERRELSLKVVNAHSVYVETLQEVGLAGLALLLAALGAPLVGAVRARQRALVPAGTAAYAAFLVHGAVDWDWELPGVSLAALLCGAALLAAARRGHSTTIIGPGVRLAAAVAATGLAGIALAGLVSNRALEEATTASERGDWASAESRAQRAQRWAPWSAEPWRLLGQAQLQQGLLQQARASFESALAQDAGRWDIWLDLAFASEGGGRQRAAERAQRLNPLSPEIDQVRPALGLEPREG